MGEEDGCDGSLGIWRKQKKKPWNNTKQIFPEQKSKKSFVLRHLCPVHWTNCQFIWSRKVYIWLSSWEFQKLWLWQPCLNKLMHVENWETDQLQHDLRVCGHLIQIRSCMGICFSCMYTNKCDHFHKWFGTLYRDNFVLMRVPDIHAVFTLKRLPR